MIEEGQFSLLAMISTKNEWLVWKKARYAPNFQTNSHSELICSLQALAETLGGKYFEVNAADSLSWVIAAEIFFEVTSRLFCTIQRSSPGVY